MRVLIDVVKGVVYLTVLEHVLGYLLAAGVGCALTLLWQRARKS